MRPHLSLKHSAIVLIRVSLDQTGMIWTEAVQTSSKVFVLKKYRNQCIPLQTHLVLDINRSKIVVDLCMDFLTVYKFHGNNHGCNHSETLSSNFQVFGKWYISHVNYKQICRWGTLKLCCHRPRWVWVLVIKRGSELQKTAIRTLFNSQ